MTVRAKFYVSHIAVAASANAKAKTLFANVTLSPVCDEDNKSWSAATPSGEIKMTITNPDAIEQLQPGKCYFVDFTPAD